ncbi:MAG TPA: 16S rRNA (guanine(966)-N(2))-methyltransferase RsmD [Polyangiaceae bacterium]|jgi:16S rRNA (guanine966-N2)-methyltransferase
MRITGGELRSRALKAPKGHDTRPTSDRVREALFSILTARGGVLAGARVLDLYAGTGALGLEALSRGAAAAVFVERSREALAVLRANIASLGVGDRAVVVGAAVEKAEKVLRDSSFGLVFADPPYADVKSGVATRALEAMVVPRLEPAGLVVLEHASRDPAPPLARLALEESRTYGDTCVTFYRAAAPTD